MNARKQVQSSNGVDAGVRTFVVLDTETTPDVDGTHRVVSLAVRRIVDGEPAESSSWLVNPQMPITTAWLHGITDDKVQDAPLFSDVASQLAEFLDGENVVVVGHRIGFDLAVLRGEYRRYELGSLPSYPHIDTMSVARLLGVSNRTTIRLQSLADRLNVAGSERPHNALSDVDATIRVFLALVDKSADTGSDVGSWVVNGRTPNVPPNQTVEAVEILSGKHLALHQRPATETRLPVDDVLLCVRERCGLVADRVELLATPAVARRLLKSFGNKPPKLRNQGEAGTLAGVLQRLVPLAFDTGLDAEHWYLPLAPTLNAYPRCGTTTATQCPACRQHGLCPQDVLHQSVAHTVLGITPTSGKVSRQVAKQWNNRVRLRDRFDGRLTADTSVYYGYALWLNCNALTRQNHVTQAVTLLGKAVSYGLHLSEPRLALEYLPRLEQSGQYTEVDALREVYATTSRTVSSTDTAFAEVELWLMLFDARHRPDPQADTTTGAGQAAKFSKSPRFVRPINRVRANKFKV